MIKISDTIRTAAAYIRVSTDDQVELSPDSQLEQIQEYAKRNNIIVPEEYIFIEGEKKKGLSGRKAANRPKFQQMIALAKEKPKPFDCILLWKFSRFARNIDEATYYKSILRNKCGIDVISISEPIMEGMYGRLIEMIIEWSDEFYSFNLATEVKRGMSAKAKVGEFCSYAPIGYKMVDKKLVIDEETAPLVKQIYQEYASGGKVRQMAISLTERGVRTRFGNPIDNRFINYIVSNPTYKGYIAFSTDGKRKRGEIIDTEKVIYQKGIHEPIIDDELWQKCYDRYLSEKSKQRRETRKNEYALRTLLKCSNCGATLTYCTGGRLQCSKYNRSLCKVSHSVDADIAEREVVQRMRIDAAILSGKPRGNSKPVIDNSQAINAIKKKIQRLDDAYLNEVYSAEEYKEMRKSLMSQASELEAAQSTPIDSGVTRADIVNILKGYDKLSAREKNLSLIKIIDKVVAHKTPDGYNFEIFYK